MEIRFIGHLGMLGVRGADLGRPSECKDGLQTALAGIDWVGRKARLGSARSSTEPEMKRPGRRPSDDTDRHLLAILVNDARRSTASIAKDLGLARTTVHERIDRLEKSGLIAGYTVLVTPDPTAKISRAIALILNPVDQEAP